MDHSSRIYRELLHEVGAIWYISNKLGAKIIVKAPTSTIKAVVKGCKLEFTFGIDKGMAPNIFHTGLRIYDDAVHYQVLCCCQRHLDEHLSLAKIMRLSKVAIYFHNEMSVCLAHGTLVIQDTDRHNVLTLQGNPKRLLTGDFDPKMSFSLDSFEFSLGSTTSYKASPKLIEILIIEAVVTSWEATSNLFVGSNENANINISEIDDGKQLEMEIMAVMESLFGRRLWKSPRIPFKNRSRELIDIFAFSEYGIFLIEAKSMGINQSDHERTMERKVTGLQKQIEKAIDQLTGALKKIKEEVPIFAFDGNEITFSRKLLAHGIVVVSDLLPFGNWDKIIYKISTTFLETRMYVHVMDMKELMRFIGYSKGDEDMFDYLLLQRFENFVEKPSIPVYTEFTERKID